MIPSITLDSFEQHIMDIKEQLMNLPHSESTSNDLNNIGHSLHRIEDEIKNVYDLFKNEDSYSLHLKNIERKLLDYSSNPKIISELSSSLYSFESELKDISETLDEIKKEVTYKKLYVPIVLTLILIVLIFK